MKKHNSDYFADREFECNEKINQMLEDDLPDFCREFFIGIQSRTSPLTRLNYAYDLKVFFRFLVSEIKNFKNCSAKDLAVKDLEKISSFDLEFYLNYLTCYYGADGRQIKNSENGKARKLSAVRHLYKYFFKKGSLTSNMAKRVDTPKIHDKEIVRLEKEEIPAILTAAETGDGLGGRQESFHKHTKIRDSAIIALFLGTGIRNSELVGLNTDDVDFSNNSFVVTRKGGNRVILYFNDEVGGFLRDYYEQRLANKAASPDDKALFLSLQNSRITTRAVQNIVKKYSGVAAPLKKITPHKLRSTFGTQLYRNTGDIYVVADVLGHKDVNTTKKHYAAITDDIRRKAAVEISITDSEKNK